MPDNQNDFIENLTRELKPIKPLFPARTRAALWALFSFVSVMAAMLFIQSFRPGFLQQLATPQFLLETLFAFIPFISVSLVVLLLSVPGVPVGGLKVFLSLLPLGGFLLFITLGQYGAPSLAPSISGVRMTCFHEVLYLSWIPILALFFLVSRALPPHRPLFLSFLIGVAGASLPMALMQIACMYDPHHILTKHFYPAAIVTGAILIVGPLLFSMIARFGRLKS